MKYNLRSFLKSCENKKIAFIGVGVSNYEAVVMFLKEKIDVTILDSKSVAELGKKAKTLQELGAKFICGNDYLKDILKFDIVIRSPGIYFYKKELQTAIKKGVVVTSEMELFFDLCPCKIIAVTGSDGKTTTTTLIYNILKQSGYKVYLGGNIGKSLFCELQNMTAEDIVVLELSSFQLLSMRSCADIAVVTNISKNHLDVHKDMDEYISAKQNIFLHQNAFGKTILNLDSYICSQFIKSCRGFVRVFTTKKKIENDAFNGAFFDVESGNLYFCENNKCEKIMSYKDINLLGMHNIENFLAAICATFDMTDIYSIRKVAHTFKGVKHRLELVKQNNNIRWYNDSIATSPNRTIAALKCFDENIILISGGYDKNLPFDELADLINKKVSNLILMGNTREKIEEAVLNCKNYNKGLLSIFKVEDMEQAVKTAKDVAKSGDVVLLSPACASFDVYKNFEQRGEHFQNIVLNIYS